MKEFLKSEESASNEPTVPLPGVQRKRLDFAAATVRLPRSLGDAIEMSHTLDELLTNIKRIYNAEEKLVLERGEKTYSLAEGLVEAGIRDWRTPDDIPEWVTPELRAKLVEWMGTV